MTPRPFALALAAAVLVPACADPGSLAGPASEVQLAKAPPVTNPTTSWAFPLDDAALAFRSDGAFALGGESFYRNGECGATGVIFFVSG
jgi:hypothetical protein